MRTLPKGIIVGAVILILAIVASTTPAQSKKDKRAKGIEFSGFMDNYDDLKRADGFSDFVWGYTKQPLILREYGAAMIDPIFVYFHPDASRGIGLDPERLAELTTSFRANVVEQLATLRDFDVVEEPGPGVMRVRIAITDINVSRSGANVGAKVAGIATAGAGFLVPAVDVGGATMECEILDSVSGERLVAIVDTDRGRRMFNFKSIKTLGDAKAAMRQWAKEFRANLERIHEGQLPKKLEKADKQGR